MLRIVWKFGIHTTRLSIQIWLIRNTLHGVCHVKSFEENVFLATSFTLLTVFIFDYYLVPSSPQNFSLAAVAGSPTQLSARWFVPIPRNGIITGYSVYCNTSANQTYPEQMIGSNVPTIRSVVNGTTLATTLTGLNPYTQYSCYVTANTSVGEGTSSAILTTQTTQSGNFHITNTKSRNSLKTIHMGDYLMNNSVVILN